MNSYGIDWHDYDVEGLSFLGKGKGKESWDRFSKKGVSIKWDRIGRVKKNKNGREWLLVKKYKSHKECMSKISGISCSPSGRVSSTQCSDLQFRINIIEFLRVKGICCRMLLVFSFKDTIEDELTKTGVWNNGKTKNRVFVINETKS